MLDASQKVTVIIWSPESKHGAHVALETYCDTPYLKRKLEDKKKIDFVNNEVTGKALLNFSSEEFKVLKSSYEAPNHKNPPF